MFCVIKGSALQSHTFLHLGNDNVYGACAQLVNGWGREGANLSLCLEIPVLEKEAAQAVHILAYDVSPVVYKSLPDAVNQTQALDAPKSA